MKKLGLMALDTKEFMDMAKGMAKDATSGVMVHRMMVSGRTTRSAEKARISGLMEECTMEIGSIAICKGLEYTRGETVRDMRVSISRVISMAKVSSSGPMGRFTMGCGKMGCNMVKVNSIIQILTKPKKADGN